MSEFDQFKKSLAGVAVSVLTRQLDGLKAELQIMAETALRASAQLAEAKQELEKVKADRKLLLDAINADNDVFEIAVREEWYLSDDEAKLAVSNVMGLWDSQGME